MIQDMVFVMFLTHEVTTYLSKLTATLQILQDHHSRKKERKVPGHEK